MGEFPILNVRVRTEVMDGGRLRPLSEVFAPAYEMDIRAKAVERYHEDLAKLNVGGAIPWEYQGYTFSTTVIEKREPEEL